ncbi:MAG: M23 family metallopeptidase [Acidobacteria bacterium]|nr:M23 family metallopeptidase [Acidobacteriota bacterium]
MSWHLIARVATHAAQKNLQTRQSDRHRRSTLRRVVIVVGIISAPVTIVFLVMMLGLTAVVAGGPAAAAGGALGIPPVVFSAYLAAETNASGITADCQVDWPVIAGIWKVESNHATYRGRTVTPDGMVVPPLYGVTLDGSIPGTATIRDSDRGLLDGDPIWDRAVGPGQFLPRSWAAYGQDGNGDGQTDPQNVFDAALGTVAYLCLTSPGDYTTKTDLARALRRYNNSGEYVERVAGWVDYYRAFQFSQGVITADGLYAFPLPADTVTLAQIRGSHHDYPAADLAVPEGTPVYAAHPGTVTWVSNPCTDPTCTCGWGLSVTGNDNHRYTYCHGYQLATNIEVGVTVTAEELIMTAGSTGNAVSPHLHFQIRNPNGVLVCPQTLLEAWHQGIGLSPVTAPQTGCTH